MNTRHTPPAPAGKPDVCQPTGSAELAMLDVYMPMMKSAAIVSAGQLAVMNNLKIPLGVAVSLFVFREPANLWTLLVGGLLIGVALLPVRKS